MRTILIFDMPTETADEREAYGRFGKFLLSEGFIMYQFSVYSKLLLSLTVGQTMLRRLESNNPRKRFATLLTVMKEQFVCMVYLSGERNTSVADSDKRVIYLGGNEDVES